MPYSVASTIKGGSLGKGTAVKGKSDLDILFEVNDIKSIEELKKKLKQMKHELHNALCCGSFTSVNGHLSRDEKSRRRDIKKNRSFKVSNIRRTPFTVTFTMTRPGGTSMDVDLLVVPKISKGDAGKFSQEELTNIYEQIRAHPDQRDYYGKCLSPVQVDFVKNQPEKVKRSIRMMKDWTKTHGHKLPSYAIELLVTKTYEEFGRPQPGGITEEKLVKATFEKLKDCRNIQIHWDKHYNLDDHGRPNGPFIMDPANPYHNLFSRRTEEHWIRYNETETSVLGDPDFVRLESDATTYLQSRH